MWQILSRERERHPRLYTQVFDKRESILCETICSILSVSEGHRVFLNLATHKFYCLPDNYEIIDASLADILYVLNPTFDKELIRRLETSTR